MEVTKDTTKELGKEGIKEVKDLAEFNKGIWKQIAEKLKRLGGKMKNADKDANMNHATVAWTPYLCRTRTQRRLLEASKLMRYYDMVGHRVTISNTVYKTVIKSFTNQWTRLNNWKQQT
eukprot:2348779-Ditylum_brightwellii.AAC.1